MRKDVIITLYVNSGHPFLKIQTEIHLKAEFYYYFTEYMNIEDSNLTEYIFDTDLVKLWIENRWLTTNIEDVTKVLDFDEIVYSVIKHKNIGLKQIQTMSRKKEYVRARHLIMYFCSLYTGLSLSDIGFRLRPARPLDHATVLYGKKVILNELSIGVLETIHEVSKINSILKIK